MQLSLQSEIRWFFQTSGPALPHPRSHSLFIPLLGPRPDVSCNSKPSRRGQKEKRARSFLPARVEVATWQGGDGGRCCSRAPGPDARGTWPRGPRAPGTAPLPGCRALARLRPWEEPGRARGRAWGPGWAGWDPCSTLTHVGGPGGATSPRRLRALTTSSPRPGLAPGSTSPRPAHLEAGPEVPQEERTRKGPPGKTGQGQVYAAASTVGAKAPRESWPARTPGGPARWGRATLLSWLPPKPW